MTLDPKEKLEVQNLIKIIKRAKFDNFQGLEALALARAYSWLESLLKEPEIIEKQSPPVVSEEPLAPFDEVLAGKSAPKKGRSKK